MRNSILFVMATLWAPFASSAAETATPRGAAATEAWVFPRAVSVRVEKGPEIDGRLLDEAWSRAPPIREFRQIYPSENVAPSQRTEVRLLHDADNLYVAAWLYDDDPARIVATQMIHGRTYGSDDRFAVSLDTFGDRRNGYFFQLNGNGARREALLGQQSWNEDWDAIWQGAAKITEQGITMEFAIPFKSLSFDAGGRDWGIGFSRVIPRTREGIYWAAPGQRDFIDSPAYFGRLAPMEGLQQGLGLDVVPSAAATVVEDPNGSRTSSLEPALDLFYKPTSGVTAAVTVNTDFSATEVDDRQLNLDRFSLFFPEKRDFFLQDAGIFDFSFVDQNGRPFFSRRIGLDAQGRTVPLEVGAKVTGRHGRLNFGVLGVRQGATSLVDATVVGVGRVSVNLFEESSVGLLVTEGDPRSDRDNRVVAGDFRYRDSDAWNGQAVEADLFYLRSDTPGLEGDDGAYGLRLRYPNDRWFAYASAVEIGANYLPALGFANRTGIRQYEAQVSRRFRPARGLIRSYRHNVYYERVTDTEGALQSSELFLWNNLETAADDWSQVILYRREEVLHQPFEIFDGIVIEPGNYSWNEYRIFVGSADHRPVSVDADLYLGGFFDGHRRRAGLTVEWRQSKHTFLSLAYRQENFDLTGGRFIARLATLRADFAFTSTLSWSNLIQFDNVSDSVGFNSRFRWSPRAGRDLFLVVNQGYDVTPANRLVGTSTGVTAKAGYTLRF